MEKCTVGRCLGLDSADEGGVSAALGITYAVEEDVVCDFDELGLAWEYEDEGEGEGQALPYWLAGVGEAGCWWSGQSPLGLWVDVLDEDEGEDDETLSATLLRAGDATTVSWSESSSSTVAWKRFLGAAGFVSGTTASLRREKCDISAS